MKLISIALVSLTLAGTATASPEGDPESVSSHTDTTNPVSVGVRIGGYGFRREGDSSTNSWTECRMNGVGVFANRNVRGPLFLEAGLDTYFSTDQAQPSDLPIDRQSVLISLAGGVRSRFTSWLNGYVQLGAGAELTRVAVPYGDSMIRADKVLPEGFIGVGAELKVSKATYLGTSARILVMGNFNYDPARLQMTSPWIAAPSPSDVFDASPGFAAQAQFYLRHDL